MLTNYLAQTQDRVANLWIGLTWVDNFLMTFFLAYTVIYSYHGFTTEDIALLSIVGGIAGMTTIFMAMKKSARHWIIKHPLLGATVGAVIDGGTESLLLVCPLWKFIGDIVAGAIWLEIWRIQQQEFINCIWANGESRMHFDSGIKMCYMAGGICAGLANMQFPDLPIVPVIWASVIANVLGYYLAAYKYIISAEYCRIHALVLPCMQDKDTEDKEQ